MPDPKETCKACLVHPTDRPMGSLYKDVKEDVKMVAEYCVANTRKNHVVTPIWKECCGELVHYSVNISDEAWELYNENRKATDFTLVDFEPIEKAEVEE